MKSYFKIVYVFVFLIWLCEGNASTLFAYSGGPPFGRTGSPADNFMTCRDTDCHNSYPLNSGKAKFLIIPPDNYTPGEDVTLAVLFENSNSPRHGFQLSALDGNYNHVGTFSVIDENTQTSIDRNYIEHTFAGHNQSGNARWSVKWTAPSSEVRDPVTFYAAGNEAQDGHTPEEEDGDYIYTATAQVSRATVEPTPTPTPAGCEIISLEGSVHHLELEKGESSEVVITVIPAEGCVPEEGDTITAKVNKTDKKLISVTPERAFTGSNGQAKFTITAKKKTGKAKVKFRCEDFKKSVKVKVEE